MSCSVLTQDRLDRLVDGTLEPSAREALATHFAQPCAACLDRLQSIDGERLLIALAGPQALRGVEAQAVFERATGLAPAETAPDWVHWLQQRFTSRVRLVFALITIVCLGLAPLVFNRPPGLEERPKDGPAPVSIALHGSEVGPDVPAPRALESKGEISARDQVVFRVRLDRPAFVYLWVVSKDRLSLAHAPAADEAPTAAGDQPLESQGHQVAVEPSSQASEGRLTVVAVASPERLEKAAQLDPRNSDFARDCAQCAASRLELTLK